MGKPGTITIRIASATLNEAAGTLPKDAKAVVTFTPADLCSATLASREATGKSGTYEFKYETSEKLSGRINATTTMTVAIHGTAQIGSAEIGLLPLTDAADARVEHSPVSGGGYDLMNLEDAKVGTVNVVITWKEGKEQDPLAADEGADEEADGGGDVKDKKKKDGDEEEDEAAKRRKKKATPLPLCENGDYLVRVSVHKLKNLQCKNGSRQYDPRVKVKLGNDREQSTETQYKTSNPVYEEEIVFNEDKVKADFWSKVIVIEAWDVTFPSDKLIGSCAMDCGNVYREKDHYLCRKWFVLNKESQGGAVMGYAKISITVLHARDDPLPPEIPISEEEDDEESMLRNLISGAGSQFESLVLQMDCFEAEDMPNMGITGKTDAYVKAVYGEKSAKSKYAKNTTNPKWLKSLSLPLQLPALAQDVCVILHDYHPLRPKDHIIATLRVPVAMLQDGGSITLTDDLLAKLVELNASKNIYAVQSRGALMASSGADAGGGGGNDRLPRMSARYLSLYGPPRHHVDVDLNRWYRQMAKGRAPGCDYRGRFLLGIEGVRSAPKGERSLATVNRVTLTIGVATQALLVSLLPKGHYTLRMVVGSSDTRTDEVKSYPMSQAGGVNGKSSGGDKDLHAVRFPETLSLNVDVVVAVDSKAAAGNSAGALIASSAADLAALMSSSVTALGGASTTGGAASSSSGGPQVVFPGTPRALADAQAVLFSQIPDVIVQLIKRPRINLPGKKETPFAFYRFNALELIADSDERRMLSTKCVSMIMNTDPTDLDNKDPPPRAMAQLVCGMHIKNAKDARTGQSFDAMSVKTRLDRTGGVPIPMVKSINLPDIFVGDEQKFHLDACVFMVQFLPAMDANGLADPYVKICWADGFARSGHKLENVNPSFEEFLRVEGQVSPRLSPSNWPDVVVEFWHNDTFGRDDFMCSRVVSLVDALEKGKAGKHRWYGGFKDNRGKEVEGCRCLLSLELRKAPPSSGGGPPSVGPGIPLEKRRFYRRPGSSLFDSYEGWDIPEAKKLPLAKYEVTMTVLGIRNMKKFGFRDVQEPIIAVDVGNCTLEFTPDDVAAAGPGASASAFANRNFNKKASCIVELPKDKEFLPVLNIAAFDNRFTGRVNVGNARLPLFVNADDPTISSSSKNQEFACFLDRRRQLQAQSDFVFNDRMRQLRDRLANAIAPPASDGSPSSADDTAGGLTAENLKRHTAVRFDGDDVLPPAPGAPSSRSNSKPVPADKRETELSTLLPVLVTSPTGRPAASESMPLLAGVPPEQEVAAPSEIAPSETETCGVDTYVDSEDLKKQPAWFERYLGSEQPMVMRFQEIKFQPTVINDDDALATAEDAVKGRGAAASNSAAAVAPMVVPCSDRASTIEEIFGPLDDFWNVELKLGSGEATRKVGNILTIVDVVPIRDPTKGSARVAAAAASTGSKSSLKGVGKAAERPAVLTALTPEGKVKATKAAEVRPEAEYTARVYVICCRQLAAMGWAPGGKTSDPYVVLKLTADGLPEASQVTSVAKEHVKFKQLDPDFFFMKELSGSFPMHPMLEINVLDCKRTPFDDEVIGSVSINLEQRWYSKKWHQGTGRIVNEDLGCGWFTETRELKNSRGVSTGKIEFWVDIFKKGDAPKAPKIDVSLPPPVDVEMRVNVWNVRDCSLVDDGPIGDPSVDVFVKCFFSADRSATLQATDTHYNCYDGNATFNWRIPYQFAINPQKMVLETKLPTGFFGGGGTKMLKPSMTFELYDNRILGDLFIGSIDVNLLGFVPTDTRLEPLPQMPAETILPCKFPPCSWMCTRRRDKKLSLQEKQERAKVQADKEFTRREADIDALIEQDFEDQYAALMATDKGRNMKPRTREKWRKKTRTNITKMRNKKGSVNVFESFLPKKTAIKPKKKKDAPSDATTVDVVSTQDVFETERVWIPCRTTDGGNRCGDILVSFQLVRATTLKENESLKAGPGRSEPNPMPDAGRPGNPMELFSSPFMTAYNKYWKRYWYYIVTILLFVIFTAIFVTDGMHSVARRTFG